MSGDQATYCPAPNNPQSGVQCTSYEFVTLVSRLQQIWSVAHYNFLRRFKTRFHPAEGFFSFARRYSEWWGFLHLTGRGLLIRPCPLPTDFLCQNQLHHTSQSRRKCIYVVAFYTLFSFSKLLIFCVWCYVQLWCVRYAAHSAALCIVWVLCASRKKQVINSKYVSSVDFC